MHGFVDSKYQIGHSNIRYTNPTTSMPSQMTNTPSKIPNLFYSVYCETLFVANLHTFWVTISRPPNGVGKQKWQMSGVASSEQHQEQTMNGGNWSCLLLSTFNCFLNRSQRWKTFCFHSCQPDIEISKKKLTTSLITLMCINQPKVPKSCQDKWRWGNALQC